MGECDGVPCRDTLTACVGMGGVTTFALGFPSGSIQPGGEGLDLHHNVVTV